MRAVAMLLRAQLRQHWRSWLALAALVTLVGGLVMAAAATARRTAAAFPDFLARHGYHAVVYSSHPLIAWRLFATNFGAVPVPVVPAALLAALACGVLVAANVLAVLAAWLAARSRPAQLLRAE